MGLYADGVVGGLELPNGETLRIVPKIGYVNFLYLLFRGSGFESDIVEFQEQSIELGSDSAENFAQLVARRFALAVDNALRSGPNFQRRQSKEYASVSRGRIAAAETALRLQKGKRDPVVSHKNVRDRSTAENRIVSSAAYRALRYLHQDNVDARSALTRWIRRFDASQDLMRDLRTIYEREASGQYRGVRDFYKGLLKHARILLGTEGIGLDSEHIVETNAFLLPTSYVFEKFTRQILHERYFVDGYVVGRGSVSPRSLYRDGTYRLEPDIIISDQGKFIFLADAKYKEVDASDHYQMNIYMDRYGMNAGTLLCPASEDTVEVTEHARPDGKVVFVVGLPLADMQVTEEYLGQLVQQHAL